MRPSIHGGFLSPAHLRGLFIVYGGIALAGGVLTFLIFLVIERPDIGISFVAGMASGAVASVFAIRERLRRGRDRAMNFIHHNLSHV
jgi:hypothetical protein